MKHQVLQTYFERSGLPLELMEKKVSSKFPQFLTGEKEPSFNQLEKMARLFDIPLGLLLLDNPVDQDTPNLKFRTINSNAITEMSQELRDTITEMQEKQDFLKDQVENELNFIGKFSIDDNYLEVVNYIRKIMNLQIDYYSHIKRFNQLKFLRSKINDIGVFVFFNGKIKDNTHRSLNVDEFRGFDLVDKKAPIIFVNQKDTKNGQIFTLIHELVHLFIGDEEILGATSYTQEFDQTEAFVNKVTAELLVPNKNFRIAYEKENDPNKLADKFKVSEFVIVRRMLDNKYITSKEYRQIIAELTEDFKRIQEENRDKGSKGGNYKNNLNFRIDNKFFHYVDNALNARKISYTDAFNIVGVGYKGYRALKEG